MILRAVFVLVRILILTIMDGADGKGVIGREGFTVAFLLNLLVERAMIVGRILNTGLIKARITEGPLCGRSAVMLLQYTMLYLGLRPPSHAGNARPRARMTRV